MKKIFIIFLMIIITSGCSSKDSNYIFYTTVYNNELTQVKELSNGFFVYEDIADTDRGFERFYYIGDENYNIYPDLVAFLGYATGDDTKQENHIYNFIDANEETEGNCSFVGMEIEILDKYGNLIIFFKEKPKDTFIRYCVMDEKPYYLMGEEKWLN